MAKIDFNIIITNEAVQYAREASLNPGWYLTPKKWGISTTSGQLTVERTTDSMFTTWINQPFSGLYPSGTNKIMHSLVIPPDAYGNEIIIGEIYFIYEDYYGNEFLYAIAQPTIPLIFTPGVSQSYSFIFTLNNTNVADVFTINYTYPQEIEDHNQRDDAHIPLLRRDGQRTATGILKYDDKLEFNDLRDIVDKEYVDNMLPAGSILWWPATTPPKGWLVRDGAAYSRETYSKLFSVIGTIYGVGDGSTTFNVPDDRGLFLRGYQSGLSSNFGQKQNSALPNITGTGMLWWTGGSKAAVTSGEKLSGAIYKDSRYGSTCRDVNDGSTSNNAWCLSFDANKSNTIYSNNVNEVRPTNRNYLPIIKY